MTIQPIMDAQEAQEAQELHVLIRLGWEVAEVRGLVDRIALEPSARRQSTAMGGPDEARKGPLATDDLRSAADRLGWASENLDWIVSRVRDKSDQTGRANELPTLPQPIKDVSDELRITINNKGQVSEWRRHFADQLIQWDEQVRNRLPSWGRRERSAYLFGRELAETYWCLDDQAPDNAPDSWATLLSDDRATRLRIELRQLGAAVDVRRARCLQASLATWRDFVAAGDHRKGKEREAFDCLDRQVQMWQSLLDADTDLDGLRPPTSVLRGVAAGLSVVRAMWVQLIVLTGFTVLLAWGAWLLAHKQQYGFLSAIVAAVGAIGVTGSALATKAKAEAIHLIENINAAIDSDLDAAATTVMPEWWHPRLRDRLYAGSRTELSVVVFPALPAASGNRPSEPPQTRETGPPDTTTKQVASDGDSSIPPESVSPTAPPRNTVAPGAAPAGAGPS